MPRTAYSCGRRVGAGYVETENSSATGSQLLRGGTAYSAAGARNDSDLVLKLFAQLCSPEEGMLLQCVSSGDTKEWRMRSVNARCAYDIHHTRLADAHRNRISPSFNFSR